MAQPLFICSTPSFCLSNKFVKQIDKTRQHAIINDQIELRKLINRLISEGILCLPTSDPIGFMTFHTVSSNQFDFIFN